MNNIFCLTRATPSTDKRLRKWLGDVEVFSTLKADVASRNTELYAAFDCFAASCPCNYVPCETIRGPSVSPSVRRRISLCLPNTMISSPLYRQLLPGPAL
jgi:hypothetical protein